MNPDRKPEDFPCKHRGKVLYHQASGLCGSCNETARVLACAIHDLCTVFSHGLYYEDGKKMEVCFLCEDRTIYGLTVIPPPEQLKSSPSNSTDVGYCCPAPGGNVAVQTIINGWASSL